MRDPNEDEVCVQTRIACWEVNSGNQTTHLYGALRTQAEPENGNTCLVDIAARAWQGRAMLGGPENQFSLTRAVLSTGGLAKSKLLPVTAKKQFSEARS